MVIICLLAAPVAAELSVSSHRGTLLAGSLVAGQAGLIAWVALSTAMAGMLRRRPRLGRAVRAAVCLAICAATVWLWGVGDHGPSFAAAVPHMIAYLGLLAVFASSLAPGREAIVTMIARRRRGEMSGALRAYTRHVTRAWCGLFIAQLAVSLALALTAPPAWHLAFINLCNLPLVLAMFAGERAIRHWRHGPHPAATGTGALGRLRHMLDELRLPARQAEP